jgi:type II secretory pathway component PulL
VRRKVAEQLATGAGPQSNGLLLALQSLAHALGAGDGRLRALNFREGNTEFLLRAKDVQVLERVRESLRGDGLNAELVGGGNSGGGAYEGAIQVKPAGGKS